MSRRVDETKARIAIWLGQRASRNTGFVDRLCRWLLQRATRLPVQDDFMRDAWIDAQPGFDPDELARYQRGDTGHSIESSPNGGHGAKARPSAVSPRKLTGREP